MELTSENIKEKVDDYLEEKFPKGKNKQRGEAIVLISLAHMMGVEENRAETSKVIDKKIDEKNKQMEEIGLKLNCICGKCDLPVWIDGKELKKELGIK